MKELINKVGLFAIQLYVGSLFFMPLGHLIGLISHDVMFAWTWMLLIGYFGSFIAAIITGLLEQ